MSVNTVEFMQSFNTNVERTKKNYDQAFRAMALQLFGSIITRTPVDEGRARGNWQVTINSPANGELETTDKGGQRTLATGSRSIASRTGEQVLYFTNNLPYIQRLENGWSQQAPSGMVRVTLTEFEAALRKAASEVNK